MLGGCTGWCALSPSLQRPFETEKLGVTASVTVTLALWKAGGPEMLGITSCHLAPGSMTDLVLRD